MRKGGHKVGDSSSGGWLVGITALERKLGYSPVFLRSIKIMSAGDAFIDNLDTQA